MKNFLHDLAIAKEWSEESFFYLPWRKKRCFYHTLVSEVMLQQTTVTTVMNRFEQFIKTFPDLNSLAQAEEAELLRLWQGLGYYNRAKRLKLAAQKLSAMTSSDFNVENLLKVPGIGNYTANALIAIGLDQSAFAIDVNLERVLIRYGGYSHLPQNKKNLRENLQIWLEKSFSKKIKNFRAMHESLMDVGRVFCQARKRDCLQCPLKKGCRSFAIQKDLFQDAKPPKSASAKKNQEQIVELARIVCIKNKKILLVQRETGQWLSGQWEVPTFVIKGTVPDNQYPPITFQLEKTAKKISSTITKYQFQNHIIFQKSLPSNIALKKFYKWIEISQLAQLPLTSITHKIEREIKSFLKNQEAHKPDSVL